jgi:hypothetical protein
MTAPIPAGSSSHTQPFQLLLAPAGQLSGDGQLRDLMLERRNRTSGGATPPSAIWFLPQELLRQLELKLERGLGSANQHAQEGLLTEDPAVHVWLQLRFGGRSASPSEIARLTPKLGRGDPGRRPRLSQGLRREARQQPARLGLRPADRLEGSLEAHHEFRDQLGRVDADHPQVVAQGVHHRKSHR